jgi:hypothetical protein
VGKLSIVSDSTGAIIGLIEPESNHVLKSSSGGEWGEHPQPVATTLPSTLLTERTSPQPN